MPSVSRQASAVTLKPHPQTRQPAVRRIGVRTWRTPATLALTYTIEAELERLRIPPPQQLRCVTDDLWRHTCCELFIARQGTPAYHEFNFSPSGEWAVYAFARYRERIALEHPSALDPQIAVRRSHDKLELDALIPLERLSPPHSATLKLALSAVLEDRDGGLSYWAVVHPPGKPDFHHPDTFVLELDEIRN